jgi:hypothetical protein
MTMTDVPNPGGAARRGVPPSSWAERDAVAMSWVVEMGGMPLDLLTQRLATSEGATRQVLYRWRKAGWVETGALDAGPLWVWATAKGVARYGRHDYAHAVTSAAKVRHLRAVIVARWALESEHAGGSPGWRSERELRWELANNGTTKRERGEAVRTHIPDAEMEVTGTDGIRRRIAVEVELVPKAIDRTEAIIREVLERYGRVLYLVSSDARPVVERAARGRSPDVVVIRDLPAGGGDG